VTLRHPATSPGPQSVASDATTSGPGVFRHQPFDRGASSRPRSRRPGGEAHVLPRPPAALRRLGGPGVARPPGLSGGARSRSRHCRAPSPVDGGARTSPPRPPSCGWGARRRAFPGGPAGAPGGAISVSFPFSLSFSVSIYALAPPVPSTRGRAGHHPAAAPRCAASPGGPGVARPPGLSGGRASLFRRRRASGPDDWRARRAPTRRGPPMRCVAWGAQGRTSLGGHAGAPGGARFSRSRSRYRCRCPGDRGGSTDDLAAAP